MTHYGTCRFRHYYCTGSIVFIVLGIRSAFLCSVMKLLQNLFFCVEFKTKRGFSVTSRRLVIASFYHYHHSCNCGYHTSSTPTHLTSCTSWFLIIPDSGFKEPCLTITEHYKLKCSTCWVHCIYILLSINLPVSTTWIHTLVLVKLLRRMRVNQVTHLLVFTCWEWIGVPSQT